MQTTDYTNLSPGDLDRLAHGTFVSDKKTGETYRVYKTESRHGLQIATIVNGKTQFVRHRVFYEYYEGRKTKMVTYYYGRPHGLYESYHRNGGVEFRYRNKHGVKHGLYESYSSRGVIRSDADYVDGSKIKSRSYSGGKLEFETNWKNGRRHGERLYYRARDGKLLSRTVYENGQRVGETQRFN